jgi:hypothetical protein
MHNNRLHADAQTYAAFVGSAALHFTTKASPVWALVSRALCWLCVWSFILKMAAFSVAGNPALSITGNSYAGSFVPGAFVGIGI